ncbi:MAG: hypothetical protein ACTHVE_04030 [Senegalia sp. (in: firmicutes)]|uniref:hypothetical protein n=1 Tax=Senegalia sp. (in: firmicutes) TaxID=1924098 RepID=UPI003F9B53F1
MKGKLIALILIIFSFISFNGVNAEKPEKTDDYKYGHNFDIGSYIRIKEQNENFLNESKEIIRNNASKVNFISDKKNKYFLNKDLEFDKFILKGESDYTEVWIGEDIDKDNITNEQIEKIMRTFDSKIYPIITDFFGKPNFHDGTNAKLNEFIDMNEEYYYENDGKIILLINDIDSNTTGYYSNLAEEYADRNIITIDSRILDKRIEKAYFNSLVHEFQHLIHSDNDKDEEIWLDEMMSSFAETLVFKNIDKNKVDYFSNETYDSFTNWGKEFDIDTSTNLAYRGEAYLFVSYLYDNYGECFLRTLAKDKDNGLESMDKLLKGFYKDTNANKVFENFHKRLDIN